MASWAHAGVPDEIIIDTNQRIVYIVTSCAGASLPCWTFHATVTLQCKADMVLLSFIAEGTIDHMEESTKPCH